MQQEVKKCANFMLLYLLWIFFEFSFTTLVVHSSRMCIPFYQWAIPLFESSLEMNSIRCQTVYRQDISTCYITQTQFMHINIWKEKLSLQNTNVHWKQLFQRSLEHLSNFMDRHICKGVIHPWQMIRYINS